jgi:hypothetical protein
MIDPVPAWIALACTALLLAHAAVHKLADRAQFEQHLSAYRVPAGALPLLAWLLPVTEAALAMALLTPWRSGAAAGAAVLLLAYAGVMAWQLVQGRRLDCGCGGEPLPLSWALVLRNLVLAAVALLAAAPPAPRALAAADWFVVVAALALATLLHAALQQMLRQRARLAT